MNNFSENLKRLREEQNLTRQELAYAAGITSAAIGYYESGKREPQASTLVAIASALHVSTDMLLGYEVNEVQNAIDYFHDHGMMVFENDSKHVRVICSPNDFFLPQTKSSPSWGGLSVSLSEKTFLALIRYAKDRTKDHRDSILLSECERLFLLAWLKQLTELSPRTHTAEQEGKALDEFFARVTAKYKGAVQTKEKVIDAPPEDKATNRPPASQGVTESVTPEDGVAKHHPVEDESPKQGVAESPTPEAVPPGQEAPKPRRKRQKKSAPHKDEAPDK